MGAGVIWKYVPSSQSCMILKLHYKILIKSLKNNRVSTKDATQEHNCSFSLSAPEERCSSRILFLAITSFYRLSYAISPTANDTQIIINLYLQPLPQLSTRQTPSTRYSKLIMFKLNSLSVLLYPFFS